MFYSSRKRLSIHTDHGASVLAAAPQKQIREPTKTRHVIFVRHGQYCGGKEYSDEKLRVLTALGRKQAELTGQRLAQLASTVNSDGRSRIKAIHVSNLTRAKETAKIIAKHLPKVPLSAPDPILNEATPAE